MVEFVAGLTAWTLIEYLLHRFVFHRFRGLAGAFHHEHHVAPKDLRYLFVRPQFAVIASAIVFGLMWAFAGNAAQSLKVMAGIWTGYAYYESVHYRIHFSVSDGPLIRRQRRGHFLHHF